jgi:DME family drug/metabolite transporter
MDSALAAQRRTGPWLILAAAALWSTAGAAIKLCTLNAWQISLGRSLVAAVVLWLFLPGARVRPSRGTWAVAAAYAVTVVLFTVANKLTTSANAIFLQDTAPLYVLLLSPFLLRERPSRGELLSVPLFLLGLLLFFRDQLTPGQVSGNLLALLSGVSFALCILGLRRLGGSNAPALVLGNLLAVAASFPGALSGTHVTLPNLGIVLFLGVFQLGLSYALFARGVRHTPATEASLLALLEPVLNPVWTFLLAGERPGPWALAGGSLILLGTLWRTLAPWMEMRAARAGAP